MKVAGLTVAVAVLTILAPLMYADSVVVPNYDATVVANDESGSLAFSAPSVQVEDDIDRAQFSAAGGPIWITGYAWRMKPGTGGVMATVSSASIYLSTTPYAADTSSGGPLLTTDFATNLGPDNTLVLSLGSGTLWSNSGCAGPGPCPFNLGFTFSTPFLYNPAQGNLLLSLQAVDFNGTGSGEFDVASYGTDPAHAIVDEITASGASPSATGAQEYSDSVTEFFYTPASAATPEPATFVMMGLGSLLLALIAAPRMRRQQCC